jgi:hypothetical protein
MMPDRTYNKAVFNGKTYIDLSSDTIQADKVLYGYTFHDRSGAILTGTNTYDADTSDANASTSEILSSKTAYVNGVKVTGSMNNQGAWSALVSEKDDAISIPSGFHDGSGVIGIDTIEKSKLIPSNIKAGIILLGVEGEYTGEGVTAQSKTTTPTFSQQTILPDADYDYLSQVIVNAIPITETLNAAGGYTVTIG